MTIDDPDGRPQPSLSEQRHARAHLASRHGIPLASDQVGLNLLHRLIASDPLVIPPAPARRAWPSSPAARPALRWTTTAEEFARRSRTEAAIRRSLGRQNETTIGWTGSRRILGGLAVPQDQRNGK